MLSMCDCNICSCSLTFANYVCSSLNFFDESEKVQFHLGVLDLDLVIRIEKPTDITDDSSNEEKAHYMAW